MFTVVMLQKQIIFPLLRQHRIHPLSHSQTLSFRSFQKAQPALIRQQAHSIVTGQPVSVCVCWKCHSPYHNHASVTTGYLSS